MIIEFPKPRMSHGMGKSHAATSLEEGLWVGHGEPRLVKVKEARLKVQKRFSPLSRTRKGYIRHF